MNRVLLITEEPVLAAGLVSVLASVSTIQLDVLMGLSSEIVDIVRYKDPDVLLLDFVPEQYALLLELRNSVPACKIVLWVRGVPIEIGCQTMRLGVRGILKKTAAPDLLLKCMERVIGGEYWFDQEMTAGFLETRTVALTPRESQIVPLISQGLKNKEIATVLKISEATIRIYLSALFRKLGVKDRYELAIFGMRNMPASATSRAEAVNGAKAGRCAPPEATQLRFMVLGRPPAPAAGDMRRKTMSRGSGRKEPGRLLAGTGNGRWG